MKKKIIYSVENGYIVLEDCQYTDALKDDYTMREYEWDVFMYLNDFFNNKSNIFLNYLADRVKCVHIKSGHYTIRSKVDFAQELVDSRDSISEYFASLVLTQYSCMDIPYRKGTKSIDAWCFIIDKNPEILVKLMGFKLDKKGRVSTFYYYSHDVEYDCRDLALKKMTKEEGIYIWI